MKIATILFVWIFWINSFSQDWKLNEIEEDKKLPFNYWIQFQNFDENSNYEILKKPGFKPSTIEFSVPYDDFVKEIDVEIINLDNDSILNFSPFNGEKLLINLEKGNYGIKVESMDYDSFNLNFCLKDNQYLNLSIELGLGPELEIYEVHSKNELNENELNLIMRCIKINRFNFYKKCSKRNQYEILIQI